MDYFDLHCDTAFELYKQNQSLLRSSLAVDMERASAFGRYSQFFAVWSEDGLSGDEAYAQFFKIRERLLAELAENDFELCLSGAQYASSASPRRAFLSVEGASLLSGKLSRLEKLYESGVRLLALFWKGENELGGAWDTGAGLTSFGLDALRECERLGIMIDVSHASPRAFFDIAEAAKKPFIASHSDIKSVYPHPRNLTDEQFRIIMERGGVAGLNLCAEHLGPGAGFAGALRHALRFMELGGEDCLCLGCDFDGAPLPEGVSGVESLPSLPSALRREGGGESFLEKLFWRNAERFVVNNL